MISKIGRFGAALAVAACGLSASFNAQAAQTSSDIARQAPICHAANGKRVVFKAVSAADIARSGYAVAMTNVRAGVPTVYYDAARLARAPKEFSTFILYHECAHQMLGHTSGRAGASRETDADCKAMKMLVAKGYGKSELAVITGYFNAHFASARVDRYYPPMDKRMKQLEQCFARIG